VVPVCANLGAAVCAELGNASLAAWLIPSWNLCTVVGFIVLSVSHFA
jgi:hypothetical protein